MHSLLLHIVAFVVKLAAAPFNIVTVRRRVAFLSRQSKLPSQDFRLLTEELQRRDPSLDIKFCLTDPETKGVMGFAKNTLAQLKLARTSSAVIVDGYLPAVSVPRKRTGVTTIQMWHALGAIKRFGYQCLDTPGGRSSESARILRMHRNYDVVVAGGSWAVDHLAAAFDVPDSVIVPVGLPRLDYLASDSFAMRRESARGRIVERFPGLGSGCPNIVYAPTFRRNDSDFGQRQLEIACECMTGVAANLIFTGHPLEESCGSVDAPGNVFYGTGFSTIELLSVADAVVTDYSAVAYEAAALGIPVFFYVPDIQGYRISPGLNVDPLRDFPDCSSESLSAVIRHACENLDSGYAFAESVGAIPANCTEAIAGMVLGAI